MGKVEAEIEAFITDPLLQKRLAKYIVQRCVRNSVLEDLHAGIVPDSKAGDCSDVVDPRHTGKFLGVASLVSMTWR